MVELIQSTIVFYKFYNLFCRRHSLMNRPFYNNLFKFMQHNFWTLNRIIFTHWKHLEFRVNVIWYWLSVIKQYSVHCFMKSAHIPGNQGSIEILVVWYIALSKFSDVIRGYFKQLLRAVPAPSALIEKGNAFFSTKNFKNTFRLVGCSVLNALNLEKWGVKIHKCALSLGFLALFGYTLHMPLFCRISPGYVLVLLWF